MQAGRQAGRQRGHRGSSWTSSNKPGPATIGKKNSLSLSLLFRNLKWAADKNGATATGTGTHGATHKVRCVWGTSKPNMFNGVIYVGAPPPCPYTTLWLPCLPRLGCNLSTRGGRKKIICHLNLKIIYFYEANTSRAQEQWPQGADREGRGRGR